MHPPQPHLHLYPHIHSHLSQELAAGGGGGLPSHEAEQRAYVTRRERPVVRSGRLGEIPPGTEAEGVSRAARAGAAAVASFGAPPGGPHQGFSPVEFVSDVPLRLSAFQDLVSSLGGAPP